MRELVTVQALPWHRLEPLLQVVSLRQELAQIEIVEADRPRRPAERPSRPTRLATAAESGGGLGAAAGAGVGVGGDDSGCGAGVGAGPGWDSAGGAALAVETCGPAATGPLGAVFC